MKRKDEWRIEAIERVLIRTGNVEKACAAADINKTSFYEWLEEEPDFAHRVLRAKKKYALSDDDAIYEAWRKSLIVALTGSVEIVEVEETTTLPSGDTITKKSKRKIHHPPAEWASKLVAPAVPGGYGNLKTDITSDGKPIAVVGYDVVMPEITGRQLSDSEE